jgi:hypothetical protein
MYTVKLEERKERTSMKLVIIFFFRFSQISLPIIKISLKNIVHQKHRRKEMKDRMSDMSLRTHNIIQLRSINRLFEYENYEKKIILSGLQTRVSARGKTSIFQN